MMKFYIKVANTAKTVHKKKHSKVEMRSEKAKRWEGNAFIKIVNSGFSPKNE